MNIKKIRSPKKPDLVNNLIPFPKLFLIDENGKSLGVHTKKQAITLAKQKNLDLICINANIQPPICKIVNYDNYRFNRQKRQRKFLQKKPELEEKEIRLSASIAENDLKVKVLKTKKFLQKKYKVKVTMRLRGREKYLENYGVDKIDAFLDMVKDYGKLIKQPKLKNNAYNMCLEPLKVNGHLATIEKKDENSQKFTKAD